MNVISLGRRWSQDPRLTAHTHHSHALFAPTVQSVGCRSRARLDRGSTVDLALHSYWAPSFFFRHTLMYWRQPKSGSSFHEVQNLTENRNPTSAGALDSRVY